jgi:4-hydroxy-3-methylbut-2-enyl diphosphate reductase
MCFGVRDAIALALKESQARPITILGDLVHNDTVLAELRHRSVQIQEDIQSVDTETVMVTAHGTSEKRISEARALGLNVLSAACPLVDVAHHAIKDLVRDGFHPVVIGKHNHVEVRGLTGDFDEFDVVLNEDDVQRLEPRSRFGIIAQTTQPIDKVHHLVDRIRSRFPDSEVRFADTVCRPTKERQNAAIDIAQRCNIVIVIGGVNSNNTRELVQTCSRYCRRVYHVQNAVDLHREWFSIDDTIGITAGTSTPDRIIDEVEKALRALANNRQERPEAADRVWQSL